MVYWAVEKEQVDCTFLTRIQACFQFKLLLCVITALPAVLKQVIRERRSKYQQRGRINLLVSMQGSVFCLSARRVWVRFPGRATSILSGWSLDVSSAWVSFHSPKTCSQVELEMLNCL